MSEKPQIVIQQPAPTNGLGTAGFIVSLAGLVLTCGALCPIGMIMSFFAMFRAPRGLAIAGLILGFIGGGWFLIVGLGLLIAFLGVAATSEDIHDTATFEAMARFQEAIAVHAFENDGRIPSEAEVDGTFRTFRDAWNHDIAYTVTVDGYELRSAGPDGAMDTGDDLVRRH